MGACKIFSRDNAPGTCIKLPHASKSRHQISAHGVLKPQSHSTPYSPEPQHYDAPSSPQYLAQLDQSCTETRTGHAARMVFRLVCSRSRHGGPKTSRNNTPQIIVIASLNNYRQMRTWGMVPQVVLVKTVLSVVNTI